MSANRITVAVLGSGRQGRVHAQSLLQINKEGLNIAGHDYQVRVLLYGRDHAKAQALAQELGIEDTTTNLEEAVTNPAVTVVDNCLINSLHYAPLMQAIAAGKHCITEKPLTGELSSATALVSAAEKAGIRHTIIQNMRYLPGPAKVKELLTAGQFGRIYHLRAVFGYLVPETITNRPAWFYQRDASRGGIITDIMAHLFDLTRWYFGPVQSVFCQASNFLPERRDAQGNVFSTDVDDVASLVIRYQNGAMADIFLSWLRRKHEDMPFFEIDGQDSSAIFSYTRLHCQGQSQALHSFAPLPQAVNDPLAGWQEIPLPAANPFHEQLQAFLTAVITRKPFQPDWRYALENERLVDLAYRSAEEGRMLAADTDRQ